MDSKDTEQTKDTSKPEALKPAKADWFLQALIKLSNGEDIQIGFPLTVSVGGLLFSGHTISAKKYFDGFAVEVAAGVREKFSAEVAEKAKETFRTFGEKGTRLPPEGDAGAQPQPDYLHLEGVQVFHPGGQPVPKSLGASKGLWRVRVTAVDAFTLGTLSYDPR